MSNILADFSKNVIDEKKAQSFECFVDNSLKTITINKTSFINDIIGIKSEVSLENLG